MDEIKNYMSRFTSVFDNLTPEEMAAHDAEIAKREAEQEKLERAERFKNSGVPERYQLESLDSYRADTDEQKKALNSARGFAQAVKCGAFKSLVYLGNAGIGKTHLACAIVRECGGKYRTAPDIVEELRRAKSFTAHETEEEIVNYYGRVSLLVIDEIGRGINAADEKYTLYQILNARYNTRKPTVLISNFNKADFLQYVGVAAADRLVESANILEINGTSYRQTLRGAK